MATHELYIGGPPTRNYSQSMFPAVPFNEAAKPFTDIGVAAHKGPIGYADTRLLDFGEDHALSEFIRETPPVIGDTLGVVLIPSRLLFLGFWFEVINPVVGLTLTPTLRGKAIAFTAITAATANSGFVGPAGGAPVTEGVVDLSAALFDVKPDMLDLTLTALPAEGLGGLKMVISPVLLAVDTGGYR